mgnify:CR=1 FL=1
MKLQNITDREMSWLSFNQRVLELAEDPTMPLLERVRFLAIFSSNLDEFYMVRVATLMSKLENGITAANVAGFTPIELMKQVSLRTNDLMERHSRVFHEEIEPLLKNEGIEFLHWDQLDDTERGYVTKLFHDRIFPVLTPLAVDPSHPFPYISGLSLNLGVMVKNPKTSEEYFARVKVPPILSRFISVSPAPHSTRFLPLEELIAIHLQELFPGMLIEDHYTFRITRNQDIELEDEDTENLLTSIEQELARRRFGPPVRLEIESGVGEKLRNKLCEQLNINPANVLSLPAPLNLVDLSKIADLDLPKLKYPPFRSRTVASLREVDSEEPDLFFAAIRQGEILLHHPYQSFTSSVVKFLENAARDPHVLAIKQTLYRTSGDSPIVEALIEAAEAGKQVLAVVEIRARFDEMANVRWARKLEEVGVHVVYGLMGLKTHAKLSLVVREEGDVLRRYCHVGTGNYNPKTARFYDDLGILSSEPELGEDLSRLFNELSGHSAKHDYSRILVAPHSLRKGLLSRIHRETKNHLEGKTAWIRLKLNSLLDEEIIAALYEAADAGVKIEIIVRGICALQFSTQAQLDNIKVRSILGRFLEHSRIYYFKNDGAEEYYIGSADVMQRNLDRRVEALVRIDAEKHKDRLRHILDDSVSENYSTWSLLDDNQWQRKARDFDGNLLVNFQDYFVEKHNRA